MAVTAKVVVNNVVASSPELKNISMYVDYADGINKEWAAATPALALQMTVRNDVADHFKMGQKFTLTFTPEESK